MEPNRYVLKLFLGIISLQLIVKYLKVLIKEERPVKSKTYGMPSSKAATLCFILSYMLMNHKLKQTTQLILIISLLLGLYMKYHVNEHTLKQLTIGGILGFIYALLLSKFI